MSRVRARRFASLLVIAALLGSLLAPLVWQPISTAAQTSDSLCTGAPNADYSDPCGPSVTIPAWSDAAGWDNSTYADTITLFDLDGDGTDELIGRGLNGLLVYTWSADWGQWVPASDLSKPLPFPAGSTYGSILFGMLNDSLRVVIALPSDGSGLQTWTWNPGGGSAGSGYWTLLHQNGPFGANDPTTSWDASPAYYSTIQFTSEPLGGLEYGIIARGADGIHFCAWQTSSNSWSCWLTTSAFDDIQVTDSSSTESWPNNLAEYYWGTIQLADLDAATPGPELIGINNLNESLMIYGWDTSTGQFNILDASGNAPFQLAAAGWPPNTLYTSTIQAVQLNGAGQPMHVIGRSASGLEWYSLNDSGCGGQPAPCWKNNTIGQGPLSDYNGYGQPQYAATMRFYDLDGNGIDELLVRSPSGELTSWALHSNAGWYQLSASGPQLTSGPSTDPLWSDPTYYETLHVGVVSDDQRPTLIMRGKYGMRTFQYWSQSAWSRPLPYGFGNFATTAEDNAFALLNGFLNIAAGNTIRDSYTSINSDVMANYEDCLNNSIVGGQTMPPTETCDLTGLQSPLANPHNVTAADWQNMVKIILAEVALARDVDGHFNGSLSTILNDLYDIEPNEFDSLVQTTLFPSNTPSSDTGVVAVLTDLFFGFVKGLAGFAGPEASFPVDALAGSLGAVTTLQSPEGSQLNTELEDLRQHIVDTNTAAIQRNSDMFQYVAQDGGLLNLYGNLISDQIWEIQADQQNAAISSGEYTTAEWLYTTILPAVWNVGVCSTSGGSVTSTCDFNQIDTGSTNSLAINVDNQTFYAYLNNPWFGDESGNYVEYQLSDTDPTFLMVFGENPSDCAIAGTDPSSNWSYDDSDGRDCTLAKNIQAVLAFQDPLSANFQCWVYYALEQNFYQCGQGPPTDYGPPS